MSSIFGLCKVNGTPVKEAELISMMENLNYWVADYANVWLAGNAGLGYLMLYNTPESLNEKLPLENSEYELTITADARIDNRDELYPLFNICTYEEKNIPDSTLILLLYQKFGAACVDHLIGDFAFAIWDGSEQRLFCARDQMGVKPLFYYSDDRLFAFATEKKGILCLPGVDKTIDKEFFANQLFKTCIQAANTTIYKKIRRLPPAHSLTFHPTENKVRLSRYWTLDPFKELIFSKKDDYYEGLKHHFEEAVKCRVRTAFPLGAELSGGIDSSSITGVASHYLRSEGRNLITFSNMLDLEETKNQYLKWEDERKYAEAVIKFNDIQDFVFVTKNIWENPVDEVDFSLKINDGPEMRSQLWLLPIKQAAMEKKVRTLLSGFPGDEMVTYRGSYSFLEYFFQHKYINYFKANSDFAFKFKPFLPWWFELLIHKFKNRLILSNSETRRIFEFYKIPPSYRYSMGNVAWQDIEYRERFKSYRHFQKYRLLKPQVPLRMESESRFGLSFNMETRYPMADIRLTQYYLSMPDAMKSEGTMTRSAFRRAIGHYLPEIILKRDNKSGRVIPFRATIASKRNRKNIVLEQVRAGFYPFIEKLLLNIHNNNKYISSGNLETMRWFENNFENL